MNFRFTGMALTALFFGSAWGSVHGCGSPSTGAVARADATDGVDASAPCGVGAPAPAAPTPIATYTELVSTLSAGSRVRVVLSYSKCVLDGRPGPDAQGGMNIDTFELFGPNVVGNPQAYLAASENHLIRLGSGFVYDYVRVKVAADNSITVDVQYMNPTTFAVTVDETFTCKINDGANGEGATFFKTSG